MKKTFYTELAYVFGILFLAFGNSLVERANFGVSLVIAPAYLLHLKISQFLPWFSFGMAGYTLQLVLIIVLAFIMRRFKVSYLFSFVTAVLYGLALDLFMMLLNFVPGETVVYARVLCYIIGFLFATTGIAMLFHTYISPEAYELFVIEISRKKNMDMGKCKVIYDYTSGVASVLMSFAFFGLWHFEGIKWGSILITLANGWTIGMIAKMLESKFCFKDKFNLKRYFEI